MSDILYPYKVWGRRGGQTKSEPCVSADFAKMYRDSWRRNGWSTSITDHLGETVTDAEIDERAAPEPTAEMPNALPSQSPDTDESVLT
jgi:hypothetical protein